jgi:hypothetical protein
MPLAPHAPATESEDHAALIVALDAGDLAGADLVRAERLATSCDGCAALATDLAAIRGAMTALPVPARRRDYRLTEEDAARLRPTTWRRILDWLAAPGSTVRPLATGLATLGVVGLLLTAGLPSFGSSAAAPEMPAIGAPSEDNGPAGVQNLGSARTSAPAPAPAAGPATLPSAAPSADAAARPSAAPGAGGAPGVLAPAAGPDYAASPSPAGDRSSTTSGAEGSSVGKAADSAADTQAGIPPAVLASIALLLVGVGLFVARFVARRRLA